MNYVRLNNVCLDLREVECLEWKKTDDEENVTDHIIYKVTIHTKAAKIFTRLVFEQQLETLKESFKEYVNGGE